MYSMVLMAALTTGSSTPDCCFGGCFQNWCGCYGGHGCYGYYGGCYGCYGGCYGGYGSSYYGGCYGCWGGYGAWYGSCYEYAQPGEVIESKTKPVAPKAEEGEEDGKEDQRIQQPTKAKLIIELPADAKLFVDNHLTTATSARRVFN